MLRAKTFVNKLESNSRSEKHKTNSLFKDSVSHQSLKEFRNLFRVKS